jgi:hypothetical protein
VLFSPWDTDADEAGVPATRMGRPCLVKGILYPAIHILIPEKGRVLEMSMALDDHHLIP